MRISDWSSDVCSSDLSVGQIHKYSVALYKTLEAETGQPVGFRQVSNIRLARTRDRWDEFMFYKGVADTIGVRVDVLTPAQVKEAWPMCETHGILGAQIGKASCRERGCQ